MQKDVFEEIVDDFFDELLKGDLGAKLSGRIGESATVVDLAFAKLLGKKGVTLRNLYIPKDDGTTTEIDVIFVTAKGIFVIESKNYSGWIFGSEKDAQWTAMLPNREKHRFYNPVWQNRGHIKWLTQYLQQEIPMISVIAFSRRCELKKISVDSPLTYVINRDNLFTILHGLWKNLPDVLDKAGVEALCEKLRLLTRVDAAKKAAHVEQVRAAQRKVAMTCPKCGGQLVLRTARKGENAGKQFYGCGNYPKCRYIRSL